MTKNLENIAAEPISGIYVHVPFCGTACDFCAFYQEQPNRDDVLRYLEGVAAEARRVVPENSEVETIFWGGGTPGLLLAKDMEVLGNAVAERLKGLPKEWTIEFAPASVKEDKLKVLADMGVNRISMGVQSFDDQQLEALGRMHSSGQVLKAYDKIRAAGCSNVNIDLMFAIPGQTLEQWKAQLRRAIDLNPEHISTYCLTFEEDTALYVKLMQGKLKRSEELEAQMYLATWEILEAAGYRQYEVSNFAKPGHECLHNVNTWKMKSWVGLGPSAASQYGGRRYNNKHSLEEWLSGSQYECVEDLTNESINIDALVFGLRMNEGVEYKLILKDISSDKKERLSYFVQNMENEGYCEFKGDKLKLTTEGRIRVDSIGAELLEL